MPFTFTPKSDEEIESIMNRRLISDGIYPFLVKSATQKTSATGNPMVEVVLLVMDTEGNEHEIKDWLLSTDKMIYKLKHFCECIGLVESYAAGSFEPSSFVDRSGRCHISIQKGKEKPDGSIDRDRNKIHDYIPRERKPGKNDLNDDVGF